MGLLAPISVTFPSAFTVRWLGKTGKAMEKLDKGRGKDAPRSYSLSPVSATEKDNLIWINTLGCQLPYVFIYCKRNK